MQIALFLLTAQGIILFLHYVIYKSFAVFFLPHTWMRIVFGIIIFVLSLTFLGFTLLARSEYLTAYPWIGQAYKVSAIWMGFASYIFLSGLFASIIYIFADFVIPGISKILSGIILVILVLASVGLQVLGLNNSKEIKVTRYTTLLKNLPPNWVNKDIALMADNHLGLIKTSKDLDQTIDLVMAENPSMILIAGDLFDGMPMDIEPVSASLSRLKAKDGVYFVGGNHEEYGPKTEYIEAIAKAGVIILDDEIIKKDGVQLIGLSYNTNLDAESTEKTLSRMQIDKKIPSILVKHVPKDLEPISKAGVSLALFGHVHNGQQFPWNFLADYVYKGFAYGKNRIGESIMITTSGAGTWGPPQRIGSRNEIVLINLQDND